MQILPFICLGLKPGGKVKLTFNDNTTATCFFDGYEHYGGRGLKFLDMLYPVFRGVSKKGKMLSKRAYYSLRNIRSAVPAGGNTPEHRDVEDILDASIEINDRAEAILRSVVAEMNILFPEKKIIFDVDLKGSISATLPSRYSAEMVDIVSLYIDTADGELSCTVTTEYDRFDEKLKRLEGVDFPSLLRLTTDNIKDPYLDDEYAGNFTEHLDSWKDVPDTDRNRTPVLHGLGLFPILKANLWFYRLPEEKRKAIDTGKNWITASDQEKEIIFSGETGNH